MKKMQFIAIALLFIASCATKAQGDTLSISTNHSNFGKGDTFTTSVGLTHSGAPIAVDVYLALVPPDQKLLFFNNNNGLVSHPVTSGPSSWMKLASDVTLQDGFDFPSTQLLTYTLTGQEAPGTYEWLFFTVPTGTFYIRNFQTAQFYFSSAPVSGYTGTWNVTKEIPSMRTFGFDTFTVTDSSPGVLAFSGTGSSGGYSSSFSGTCNLDDKGGATCSMKGNLYGTQVTGTGYIDASGSFSGTINVVKVGPFIKAITGINGSYSNGTASSTETVHYTDSTSGLEQLSAKKVSDTTSK
jgi:hypothetical protein